MRTQHPDGLGYDPPMVTDDATLLLPIGHCIGAYYDVPDSSNHFFQVRIGPDVVRLTDEQFAVWGLAHGTSDRPTDQPWNQEATIAAAYSAGLTGVERVAAQLIADQVLVETTIGTESAVDFARRHRMLPLLLGLGNTAEEPRVYSVGLIGQPIVLMSSMIYDLFEWAHMDPDLWTACQGAAQTARRVEVADATATDPHHLLDALLGSMHTMLSPNAVCLDTRLVS